jgi:hypothetical protein
MTHSKLRATRWPSVQNVLDSRPVSLLTKFGFCAREVHRGSSPISNCGFPFPATFLSVRATRYRWLRHYATSRKVADSSSDEVDFFFSIYLTLPHAALWPCRFICSYGNNSNLVGWSNFVIPMWISTASSGSFGSFYIYFKIYLFIWLLIMYYFCYIYVRSNIFHPHTECPWQKSQYSGRSQYRTF